MEMDDKDQYFMGVAKKIIHTLVKKFINIDNLYMDAEDLEQEGWLVIWSCRDKILLSDKNRLMKFIDKVVRNHFISLYRKSKLRNAQNETITQNFNLGKYPIDYPIDYLITEMKIDLNESVVHLAMCTDVDADVNVDVNISVDEENKKKYARNLVRDWLMNPLSQFLRRVIMVNPPMNAIKKDAIEYFNDTKSVAKTAFLFKITEGKMYYWLRKWGIIDINLNRIEWKYSDEQFVKTSVEQNYSIEKILEMLSRKKGQRMARSRLVNFMYRRNIQIPVLRDAICPECEKTFEATSHQKVCTKCAPSRKRRQMREAFQRFKFRDNVEIKNECNMEGY